MGVLVSVRDSPSNSGRRSRTETGLEFWELHSGSVMVLEPPRLFFLSPFFVVALVLAGVSFWIVAVVFVLAEPVPLGCVLMRASALSWGTAWRRQLSAPTFSLLISRRTFFFFCCCCFFVIFTAGLSVSFGLSWVSSSSLLSP